MAGSYFINWLLLVLNRKRNQIHRVSRKFEHEKRRKREKRKEYVPMNAWKDKFPKNESMDSI